MDLKSALWSEAVETFAAGQAERSARASTQGRETMIQAGKQQGDERRRLLMTSIRQFTEAEIRANVASQLQLLILEQTNDPPPTLTDKA